MIVETGCFALVLRELSAWVSIGEFLSDRLGNAANTAFFGSGGKHQAALGLTYLRH